MGTKLADIVEAKTVTLRDLAGKKLAIDAFNTIYAFLASIRQPDGTPLMDSKKRVTSHLSGLFYRTLNLLEQGIYPAYVFDGEAPQLKAEEVARRREIRDAAYKEWQTAKDEGRIEDARKAAQASSRLDSQMIQESKDLLQALGVPVVQAPSEGEALAAQMARAGDVWASASQDNDSLLYNCPRMIRNLTISGRRRSTRSGGYRTIEPELIELDLNLKVLEITREQLIDLAILVGTDYNEGVKGVGPKTALKLIRKHGNLEGVEAEKGAFDFPYREIRDVFLNPPDSEVEPLKWTDVDPDRIREILCEEHNFGENRVDRSLERLAEALEEVRGSTEQSSLTDFF